jgi:hypothetical protein
MGPFKARAVAVRVARVEAGKGRADTQVCPYEASVDRRAAEQSSGTGFVWFAPSLDNVRAEPSPVIGRGGSRV